MLALFVVHVMRLAIDAVVSVGLPACVDHCWDCCDKQRDVFAGQKHSRRFGSVGMKPGCARRGFLDFSSIVGEQCCSVLQWRTGYHLCIDKMGLGMCELVL